MKENFLVNLEEFEIISDLPNEQLGELFRALCEYQKCGATPVSTSCIYRDFKYLAKGIDARNKRYEEYCEKNRSNGSRGGRPAKPENQTVNSENPKNRTVILETERFSEKPNGYFENPTKPNITQHNPTKPNVTQNNPLDIDIDIDMIKKEENNISAEKISAAPNSASDFVDEIIEEFASVYNTERNAQYIITNRGKERSATGKLIKIFRENLSKNGRASPSTTELREKIREYFRAVLNISDKWLNNNMTIPVLLSKFNEVNQILRNEQSTINSRSTGSNKKQPATTTADVANIIAKHYATDYNEQTDGRAFTEPLRAG